MNRSIGAFILQLSVALYLFATGILGLTGYGGGEIRVAAGAIFRGNAASLIVIILAVCAVAAGILLILELFRIEFNITEVLLIILIIVWIVFIFLIDIIHPITNRMPNFVDYLRGLGSHLMVLGGMICATKRFGSR